MKTGHRTLLGRALLQSRPGKAGGWTKTMLVFTSVLFQLFVKPAALNLRVRKANSHRQSEGPISSYSP